MSDDKKPQVPLDPEWHDEDISRLYKKLPQFKPSHDTDAEILAISRRVVDARPRLLRFAGWGGGLATAAALVLMFGLLRFWQVNGMPTRKAEPTVAAEAPALSPAASAPADSVAAAPPAMVAAAPEVTTAPSARLEEGIAAAPASAPVPVAAKPKVDVGQALADAQAAEARAQARKEALQARKDARQKYVADAENTAQAPSSDAAAPVVVMPEEKARAAMSAPAPAAAPEPGVKGLGVAMGSALPAGPWTSLDRDLAALHKNRQAELHCRSDGADAVANDACTMLQSIRAGNTPSAEDVRALGKAIKRYAPAHQGWFFSLSGLLQGP